MKKLILLFLFVVYGLSAQELSVEKKEIYFTFAHAFKTVKGHCEKIEIKGKIFKKDNILQAELPFMIIVPVEGMRTGNSNRDSHLLETLDYTKHKQIIMNLKEVEASGDTYKLKALLKIKNVEKEVFTIAKYSRDGESSILKGSFELSLKDFSIEAPSLLLIKVKDTVMIDYKFILKSK
ncbi:MAG: YceI family protein [Leptospiraceae bacterium]|nr:YceI family protein [Leptospiraceae bacterium]MCP5500397.1 YceI family protein [Leptospiraceae bacterium]